MTNQLPNKILHQSGGLASPTGALATHSFPKSYGGSDSLIDGSGDTQQGIATRQYYDCNNRAVSSESYIFFCVTSSVLTQKVCYYAHSHRRAGITERIY